MTNHQSPITIHAVNHWLVKQEPDPTATEGDWSAVDLVPVKPLIRPVSLVTIKADKILNTLLLVRNSRLSVSPLTEPQFRRLLELAETLR